MRGFGSKTANPVQQPVRSRIDNLNTISQKLNDEDLKLMALFLDNCTGFAMGEVRAKLRDYLKGKSINV